MFKPIILKNELFDNFIEPKFSFPVEISEENNNILLKVEVPGIEKENIDITYDNNILSINIIKKEEKKDKLFSEFIYGEFKRSFEFKDIKEISAKIENGILFIKLEKDSSKEIKKIEIK